MSFTISIDKEYGGFYIHRGYGFRICLGYIAFTYLPTNFDDLVRWAGIGGRVENEQRALGLSEET